MLFVEPRSADLRLRSPQVQDPRKKSLFRILSRWAREHCSGPAQCFPRPLGMVSCRYSRPPVDTRGPWSMWRPRMDLTSVESRLREVCQCPLRVGKLSPKLRFWTKFRNSGWHMPRPNSNTPDRLAALPRPGNAAKRPESTDEVDPVCPNS